MVDVKRLYKPRFLSRIRRIGPDQKGQDLIEYALLGGFVVVAVAAVLPNTLMPSVSMIFSRILGLLQTLGGGS